MPRRPEPRGSKPFLPGLVKLDFYFLTNPGYTSGAHCITWAKFTDNVNHDLADLLALATAAYDSWEANILLKQSSSTTLSHVLAQSLGGDGFEQQFNGSSAGGESGAVYPPNVSVCISWKAGITWRGGRPRSYLPQPPQSCTADVGSPNLVSAYSSSLATAAQGYIANMAIGSYSGAAVQVGVVSYYSKYALRPVPVFFPFNGAVVHDRLATQRRRLGKESTFGVD